MNSNNKEFPELDAFFEGTMSQKEQRVLFEKIKTDPELKDAYAFRLNLAAALKNNRAKEIKGKTSNWDREAENEKPTAKVKSISNWMKYAAAASIICLIGIFYWTNHQTPEPENSLALFEANFKTAKVDIERDNVDKEINPAFIYYSNKEFEKAIAAFQEIDSEDAKFYLSNSFLALNEPQKAITTLQQYNGAKFETEVEWLIALANLKLGNKKQTKEILENLTKTKGAYSHKARKLLESLN